MKIVYSSTHQIFQDGFHVYDYDESQEAVLEKNSSTYHSTMSKAWFNCVVLGRSPTYKAFPINLENE